MAEFIKPTTVTHIRSDFGYTVRIDRRGRLDTVEASLDLGKVLDLSWTKATELQQLLEKFLEDEANIILDDKKCLEQRIHWANERKKNLLKGVEDNDDELVELALAYKKVINEEKLDAPQKEED